MRSSEDDARTARLVAYAQGSRISDRDTSVDLSCLANGTCIGGDAARLAGRSILIATRAQMESAVALVELDGLVRRLMIAPPDLRPEHLSAIIEDAEIDAIVTDQPERFTEYGLDIVPITLPTSATPAPKRSHDTEWVLATSGTSGRPKLVVHSLAGLTGAIRPIPATTRTVWATFYDIRRYGGLQIFLRAVLSRTDIVLSREGEMIGDHLKRLGSAGVTSMSGTPSHWRRVLMSQERSTMAPAYVRLSGEIADQVVLDGLRAAYPDALIGHAYASTEAGVGFAVNDGREGFPADFVQTPQDGVELKVVDGTLRIKSCRAASRYVGQTAPALIAADGFIDTGDLVERRGDRYVFIGRTGGIINVGGLKVNPEEVEAAINNHDEVRMSLVQARKNPLTGAIVVADIVLRDPRTASDALKSEIIAGCRSRLERHKVPAIIRFVPALALTPGGKLSRAATA